VALLLDFRPIDYPNICSTKIKFGRLKIKFGSAHAQPVPHCPRDASSRGDAPAARDVSGKKRFMKWLIAASKIPAARLTIRARRTNRLSEHLFYEN
jgi:hypothetical protein